MLQQIRDRILNIWVAGGIIGLIAITFIFWGIDFNFGGASYAARVNGSEISLTEFDREYQNELFEYQELYQTDIDEGLRRELRRNVLERMVGIRALQQRVRETGYYVSDERVVRHIASMPAFQVDGRFSADAYRAQLRFSGYTPAQFEQLQRSQLELQELRDGIVESTFLTPDEFRRYIELYFQQREIGYALFEIDEFIDQVEVDDDAVIAHYNANRDRYRTAEAVDIEYVEVRRSDIAAAIEISDEMLRNYYERERDRFETVEERRARHILFTGADNDARERAEQALVRLEAGEDFEALAQELSDDAGTRGAGGDLGWITRGLLGGAFDDALYELEVGDVGGPVRSEFGYHLIRLDGLRAGDTQPFDVLRDELYQEYALDLAETRYFDLANELADRAFDSYDELASVAGALGVPLRTIDGLTRAGAADLFDDSAQVVQVAFGRDVLERRINSRLLELSDDQVVVLRVREHHPPVERPLDEVREEIVDELQWQRAEQLARQAAESFYEASTDDIDTFARLIDSAPTVPADDELAPITDLTTDVGDVADDAGAVDDAQADVPQTADGDSADVAAADAEPTAEERDAIARLTALAEDHGGTWYGPRWATQTDALVPTQILATAFSLPKPVDGQVPRRERVSLASGAHAVMFLSGYRPGEPGAISQLQRDMLQRQLAEQAAVTELLGYAGEVRERARVQIPAGILDEPDWFID